jgi:hypothetical protein
MKLHLDLIGRSHLGAKQLINYVLTTQIEYLLLKMIETPEI